MANSDTTGEDHLTLDTIRALLCELHDSIRSIVLEQQKKQSQAALSTIAGTTKADTIYQIDRISEQAIEHWFENHWPQNAPIEIVMEGLEENIAKTFPRGTPVENTKWKAILDPIDGTRGIMYDKRSAWILTGVAPQKGEATSLADIAVACMTEIPTSKQWRSDQISGIRKCGLNGLVQTAYNVINNQRTSISLRPSQALTMEHGFCPVTHFFPLGKTLLAEFDETLWKTLFEKSEAQQGNIFDDQYMSTGGQLFELIAGHDRMQIDVRPLAMTKLGITTSLVCHPYDICTAFLLEEFGGIIESPDGSPLDNPLNTTSPVSFVAYANEAIASKMRPVVCSQIKHFFNLSI